MSHLRKRPVRPVLWLGWVTRSTQHSGTCMICSAFHKLYLRTEPRPALYRNSFVFSFRPRYCCTLKNKLACGEAARPELMNGKETSSDQSVHVDLPTLWILAAVQKLSFPPTISRDSKFACRIWLSFGAKHSIAIPQRGSD